MGLAGFTRRRAELAKKKDKSDSVSKKKQGGKSDKSDKSGKQK